MTVCALGLAVGVAAQSKLSDPASANEKAPATYKAKFDTSKGAFVITVHRDWAPRGADRFYNLVKNGFYDDVRFFRVIDGFMAQIGMNGNPEIQSTWDRSKLQDDPVQRSSSRPKTGPERPLPPSSSTLLRLPD